MVLIDGVAIIDINEVLKINPDDVENIIINNRPYYLGEYEINGVIRINTKTKNFAGVKFSKKHIFLEYETITPRSTPVFPNHLNNEQKRIPDFRNLLYWNTNFLIPQKDQKFQFHAGNNCGEFDVIVRGYDNSGKPIYGQTTLKVEKP